MPKILLILKLFKLTVGGQGGGGGLFAAAACKQSAGTSGRLLPRPVGPRGALQVPCCLICRAPPHARPRCGVASRPGGAAGPPPSHTNARRQPRRTKPSQRKITFNSETRSPSPQTTTRRSTAVRSGRAAGPRPSHTSACRRRRGPAEQPAPDAREPTPADGGALRRSGRPPKPHAHAPVTPIDGGEAQSTRPTADVPPTPEARQSRRPGRARRRRTAHTHLRRSGPAEQPSRLRRTPGGPRPSHTNACRRWRGPAEQPARRRMHAQALDSST